MIPETFKYGAWAREGQLNGACAPTKKGACLHGMPLNGSFKSNHNSDFRPSIGRRTLVTVDKDLFVKAVQAVCNQAESEHQ